MRKTHYTHNKGTERFLLCFNWLSLLLFQSPFQTQVVQHIWSYEPEQSHYKRHKAPEKRNLKPSLNLSKIYKDFLKLKGHAAGTAAKPPLSISSFRKIWFSYNLSFWKPRKDTCGKCDSLKIVINHSHGQSHWNKGDSRDTLERSSKALRWELYFDFNMLLPMKNKDGLNWKQRGDNTVTIWDRTYIIIIMNVALWNNKVLVQINFCLVFWQVRFDKLNDK